MYKSDIQFIREKYKELAEENNRLRDEIKVLKAINKHYRELITIDVNGGEAQVG
jgi:alkylhydroperoxidase/carboxymuconolactone decarboxylase family protein YurZ